MKRRIVWKVIVCMLVLEFGAALGGAERRRAPRTPQTPRAAVNWNDHSSSEIVALVESLTAQHRYLEAIEGADRALARGLKADEDARVRHRMAACYEAVGNSGPLARQKYAEVLKLHPGYSRNLEISLRLGELYDHIILAGTEPNLPLAQEYYTRVVESYGRSPGKTAWLPVLRAHMHLGNLYARQGAYAKSNDHYEAIYSCDPELLTPLPYQELSSQESTDTLKHLLQRDLASLKDTVRKHMVSNCVRPDLATSLKELDAIAKKYSGDRVIVEGAVQLRETLVDQVIDFDKVLEDSLNELEGPK